LLTELLLLIILICFSIAVLSVFSENHYNDKNKPRKRQRSPDESILVEDKPVKLEVGIKYDVRLNIFICLYK